MQSLVNKSDSWVAFDSGITSVSRSHLEETIINHAKKLGCELEWLISHQLTSGARRVAFTISSVNSNELAKLLGDLNSHFPNFIGNYELNELISQSRAKSSGRAVKFPISVDFSKNLSAIELIENSAIDSIVAIGEELPSDAILEINGYLRPTFSEGRLELLVERIAGGFFAPIERQSPHECCGGHDDEGPIEL